MFIKLKDSGVQKRQCADRRGNISVEANPWRVAKFGSFAFRRYWFLGWILLGACVAVREEEASKLT